jgi:ribokinase
MPRFVAVGEAMLDVAAAELVPGRVVHAPIMVRAGGSPVTAALAAAAEGVDAAVVARVGDDLAARVLRQALVDAGIEPRFQIDSTLPTGTFFEARGGTIVADRGANAALDLGHVAADAALVSGYFLFNTEGDPLAQVEAEWIAVDAGSPQLVRLDRLEHANALFLDERELKALGGEVDALRRQFLLLCIKRGRDGATAYLDGREETRAPQERVERVRAGAGDAFAGSLLASLLLGQELGDAVERACAAGARAATCV